MCRENVDNPLKNFVRGIEKAPEGPIYDHVY